MRKIIHLPNVVTDVTYEPIPGGALIKYVLPHDEDLLYVKAVYSVKGEERNSVASQYNSELLIEGLPSIDDYSVNLYCIDKSGNYSKGVPLTITPEESPVNVMRNSLSIQEDFGGFKIDYENPSKAELSIYVYQKDSFMGHRTKRILRIERKEYQTY